MNEKIDIGIAEADRLKIAKELRRLLADTQILYHKTRGYHWNVTGMAFASLHKLFEEQYNELADAGDTVAERIRALGRPAPAAFGSQLTLGSIKEEDGTPDAAQMTARLATDHEMASSTAKDVCKTAQDAGDEGTADLAIERIRGPR